MKEIPDKELVKICPMKSRPTARFLSGTQCNTFDQLFERVLIYEELRRVSTSLKNAKASTNIVTELDEQGQEKQLEKQRINNEGKKAMSLQRCEWRNYLFSVGNTEKWFDVLVK